MKRTPLTRRTELSRGSAGSLKRSRLNPVSKKQRQRRQEDAERVEAEGAAFHARIRGERCVACGRSAQEAFEQGTHHQAHHGIRQEVLKRLGLRHLLWEPDNAVCVCEQPCHADHTTRKRRLPAAALPARVWQFAKRHDLIFELEQEYPGP